MTVSQRNRRNKMNKKLNHKQNQGAVIVGSSAVLGRRSLITGCCGIVMLLIALSELLVCGVPDGFWRFMGWGLLFGIPITISFFFMDELGDLCKKAAERCKARQAIGKQGRSARTVNRFFQKSCVLLLCIRDVIYDILKINVTDRNIIVGRGCEMCIEPTRCA
jgi:hypothetical protein